MSELEKRLAEIEKSIPQLGHLWYEEKMRFLITELRKALAERKRDDLKSQYQAMREALEWYERVVFAYASSQTDGGELVEDGGQRARQALGKETK